MSAPYLRLHSAPIRIGVEEDLTTCIYCDTRTDWIGERTDDGEAVENCPKCGQNYIVEEYPEC